MAANDVLSLNLFYADWCKTRLQDGKAPRDVQPFEYFIGEQFLKQYSLDDEELLRGLIGAQDDGGIDAFYFFINRVAADDSTVVDRRSENDVVVILMQIRENAGFSPTSLEKMDRFSDDLLDLNRQPAQYRYAYHARMQDLMRVFKNKMLAMGHRSIRFEYYFVTRCDEPPNDNCERVAITIKNTVAKHFPAAQMQPFNFAGPQRIYDEVSVRKPAKKLITLLSSFQTPEGWVGIVSLRDYYTFLADENSPDALNETIFDDNVRGYYQNTPVNRAITTTLTAPDDQPQAEFWLLNNGITILTPKIGLKSGSLELHDPQIVNGLQTSRRIFEYFKDHPVSHNDKRRIVIRIIENDSEEFRDQIIRATNNQNKMAAEALISTGRLHKQLDAYFASKGLFYDRRKGHYKDQGKTITEIISIITLIQAVVTIILHKPHDARGRPRDYVADDTKRCQVFGPDDYDKASGSKRQAYGLSVYLQCVLILRRVDGFLDTLKLDPLEHRNVRFYLARYAACRIIGSPYYGHGDLVKGEGKTISDDDLREGLELVRQIYQAHGGDDDAAKGKKMNADFEKVLQEKYSPPIKRSK